MPIQALRNFKPSKHAFWLWCKPVCYFYHGIQKRHNSFFFFKKLKTELAPPMLRVCGLWFRGEGALGSPLTAGCSFIAPLLLGWNGPAAASTTSSFSLCALANTRKGDVRGQTPARPEPLAHPYYRNVCGCIVLPVSVCSSYWFSADLCEITLCGRVLCHCSSLHRS